MPTMPLHPVKQRFSIVMYAHYHRMLRVLAHRASRHPGMLVGLLVDAFDDHVHNIKKDYDLGRDTRFDAKIIQAALDLLSGERTPKQFKNEMEKIKKKATEGG